MDKIPAILTILKIVDNSRAVNFNLFDNFKLLGNFKLFEIFQNHNGLKPQLQFKNTFSFQFMIIYLIVLLMGLDLFMGHGGNNFRYLPISDSPINQQP